MFSASMALLYVAWLEPPREMGLLLALISTTFPPSSATALATVRPPVPAPTTTTSASMVSAMSVMAASGISKAHLPKYASRVHAVAALGRAARAARAVRRRPAGAARRLSRAARHAGRRYAGARQGRAEQEICAASTRRRPPCASPCLIPACFPPFRRRMAARARGRTGARRAARPAFASNVAGPACAGAGICRHHRGARRSSLAGTGKTPALQTPRSRTETPR